MQFMRIYSVVQETIFQETCVVVVAVVTCEGFFLLNAFKQR